MNKFSVVIITLNEERNIKRCLESVVDLTDDIIVMDSFSTDRTEKICKQFGVRFYQEKFRGYIDTKNEANKLAKYDYILSIDADEALSPDLKESILNISENDCKDGYIMNRLTNYCGKWIKHTDWYPDKKLRLWNRNKGKWDGILIHEIVKMDDNSTVGFLKGDLFHYSYYSIAEHINQTNKFTSISAEEKFKANKNTSWVKIIFSPMWKFFKSYFLRLGFMDGFYGFVVCIISAHATFLVYAKLKQLKKTNLTR
jgi:glycosyltransferase involved in cell wall biosynthesis